MRGYRWLLLLLIVRPSFVRAASHVQAAPVPPEMQSSAFTVMVSGQHIDVAHAAASYDFVNFDITGPVEIAITAAEAGFWDRGVDIQPWRLGLRPKREGQTIRFRLQGPAKLSISRPGDFLNHAKMIFLFAGSPPPPAPHGANVRVYAPGVYHESLNPKSGETLYLAPGAYIFGSLNLWQVENVHVMGRGTIVYEGGQDPENDEGWMQKPDWHCIGAFEARSVVIEGVTCIVRARTWSIQMKDSSAFTYNDLRLIGGNPANANQDGMDWLGSGATIVRDSFLRASDDDIALIGNWDGYDHDDLVRPGRDVRNIVVEQSELSTSISNIVRLGWPEKTFNSANFTLRNSDILHAGIGACGQTFGVLGLWGAKGASGEHDSIRFENLFLDDWYSLLQVEQENPAIRGITFRNIWALDQPALAGSTISGDVHDVAFENVKFGQTQAENETDLDLSVGDGTEKPRFVASEGPKASFTASPATFEQNQTVTFTASPSPGAHFTWRFGDGTEAHGRRVRHRFADAEGTELDGSGRFRVLLEAEDETGRQDWAAQSIVVVGRWHDAQSKSQTTDAGLLWRLYPGEWTDLPDLTHERVVFAGESPRLEVDTHGFTRFVVAWDGFIEIPAEGGYSFDLMARDGARLVIDGVEVAKTGPPFAQVCGSPGNAERMARGSLGLRAGLHAIHVEGLRSVSEDWPRLLWEGPGLRLEDVPAPAFRHADESAVTQEGGID